MKYPLDVSIDGKDPGLVLIKLRGDYKELQPYLQNEFHKAINNLQYKQVLDLSELATVTKEGIADIFDQLRRLREMNGNLVLLKPNRNFSKTLSLLEAKGIFDIVKTQKQARLILNKKPLKKITSYIRLHKRKIVSTSQVISLQDRQNFAHHALLYDISENGMGIVYVGTNCPAINSEFEIVEEGKRKKKKAVVCWIQCLNEKLFRIGLVLK